MQISYKKIIINPTFPIKQLGFIQQTKEVFKFNDDLHARILSFKENNKYTFIISFDLLALPVEFHNKIKNFLNTIYPNSSIVLSCTHTHFAPNTKDERYLDLLYNLLTVNLKSLEFVDYNDIYIKYTSCDFHEVGTSRISNHKATVLLNILSFYHNNKNIYNIIIHNVHPTILSGDTDFFSSEYIGKTLELLDNEMTKNIFLQGAAGDVSTRFTRANQTYDSVIKLATTLANKVKDIITNDTSICNLLTNIEYDSLSLNIEHDKSPLKLDTPKDLTPRELETIEIGQVMRNRLLEGNDLTSSILISYISFNNITFIFNPCELFSGYIDYVNPNTSLVCYSNGYAPYVTNINDNFLTYERFTDTFSTKTKQQLIDIIKNINS